jgi:hypothetical protein
MRPSANEADPIVGFVQDLWPRYRFSVAEPQEVAWRARVFLLTAILQWRSDACSPTRSNAGCSNNQAGPSPRCAGP